MPGVLVVGALVGTDALGVAEEAAASAGARLEAVHAIPSAASPLTAARHAGEEHDPWALLERIGGAGGDAPVVAAATGGLAAPLTPRYAVRDLARELGLAVVLAVPAGPDLVGLGRAGLEAARAAGLRVAAIVATGWGEPPSRVQLDERALLAELAGEVRVEVHPAAHPWPVEEWLAAAGAPVPGAPGTPGAGAAEPPAPPGLTPTTRSAAPPVALEPYREWAPQPVGDPRETPRPRIMDALVEIVAAEGPMVATRAYALYNRASGGRKLTNAARTPLASALHWLAQERRVALARRDDNPWQDDDVARLPDAPAVLVRELGPRTLEEVPLDEIAELMRRLDAPDGAAAKRAVLEAYGLRRLTTRADAYLELALGLAAGGGDEAGAERPGPAA